MTSVTGQSRPAANHPQTISESSSVEGPNSGGGVDSQSHAPPASETPLQKSLAKLKRAENGYRHACAELQEFLARNTCIIGQRSQFLGTEPASLEREYVRLVRSRNDAENDLHAAMRECAFARTGGIET